MSDGKLQPNKPAQPGWHWADIKAALEKAGYTLARISRELGHRDRSTARVVQARPYPKVEALIGRIIGVPPAEIWPSRYGADGQPKGKPGRPRLSSPHEGKNISMVQPAKKHAAV